MKTIELSEPDEMDKAFMGKGELQGNDIEAGQDLGRLLTQTRFTDQEAEELIREYNGIYKPKLSERIRCGGTLKIVQKRLREHYGS